MDSSVLKLQWRNFNAEMKFWVLTWAIIRNPFDLELWNVRRIPSWWKRKERDFLPVAEKRREPLAWAALRNASAPPAWRTDFRRRFGTGNKRGTGCKPANFWKFLEECFRRFCDQVPGSNRRASCEGVPCAVYRVRDWGANVPWSMPYHVRIPLVLRNHRLGFQFSSCYLNLRLISFFAHFTLRGSRSHILAKFIFAWL